MSVYAESLRAFLRPVLPYLDDDAVSEILINGPEEVWVEREGRLEKTPARFTAEGLSSAARNIAQFVGRPLSEERPQLDARLPDGSRVHVVLPPIARGGVAIAIRKFFREKPTVQQLVDLGSLSPAMVRLLEAAVRSGLNTAISGSTGAGKTTFLNVLSTLIPDAERVVVLEDSAELQLEKTHLLSLESRPPDKHGKGAVGLADLLQSALRLRPDRLVIGEIRGSECFELIQALNTGHRGSLFTCHANNPQDTLRRLESLCLLSGVELPLLAVRAQVASAVQLVVTCQRLPDGSRKVIQISEVLPLGEKGEYRLQDLFVYAPLGQSQRGEPLGYHVPTGLVPAFLARARAQGMTELDEAFFDPKTHGLPPPVSQAQESFTTRWVPSLAHRGRGEPDPAEWDAQRARLAQSLEQQRAETRRSSRERPSPLRRVPPQPSPQEPSIEVSRDLLSEINQRDSEKTRIKPAARSREEP